MLCYSNQPLMTDSLDLVDSPRDFPSIRVISFIINLYLIFLINGQRAPTPKKNLGTKRPLICLLALATRTILGEGEARS